jgi:preprotein translocase subunit SecE
MDKIKRFFNEMRTELIKVSWPPKNEIWGSTVMVLVVSAILAIIVGIMDRFFATGIRGILR